MREIIPTAESLGPGRPAPAQRHWCLWALLGAILVLLGAGVYYLWQNRQNWRERETALRLAEADLFDEAEPVLRRAWQLYPHDWQVARALAVGYIRSDREAKAEPCVSRWCALRPDAVEPFRLRFALYQDLQRPEQAIADGLRVLELDPANADVCRDVVRLLWQCGRCAEVENVLGRCLAENPDHPGLLYLRAELYKSGGVNAQAGAAVDDLLRRHPGFADGIVLKAALLSDAGQPGEAIDLLRGVLARSPEMQTARYHLGVALTRAGKVDEAEREMLVLRRYRNAEQLVKDSKGLPLDLELRVRAAESLIDVRLDDQALTMLRSALATNPRLASAHRLLADYYERHGQTQAAAEHRRQADPTP
jgi:tetratricopeptide (TPR) repeat protein